MGNDAYNPAHVIDAARSLLDDAATRCHAPDRASEHNIHGIRKALKKARAYLRLMHHALGKQACKAGNQRCRDAAAHLAAARDHAVMLGTLDAVAHQADPQTTHAVGQAKQAVTAAVESHPADQIAWQHVADLIAQDAAAWSAIDPATIDPADIQRSRKRTRNKARARYRRAKKDPSAPALHDWRKWTKRWLEQEQLLHPHKRERIQRLDRLAELLGKHHDLAVLKARLKRNNQFTGQPHAHVRKRITKRQDTIAKEALGLGESVFA